MHIVIAGGSGFVGRALQKRLLNAGNKVTILTRDPSKIMQTKQLQAVQWLTNDRSLETQLGKVDAIVNLAGETINGIRWTKAKKERILQSRITTTREIIRMISQLDHKPEVLVNASAVGYYGMSETETFTEASKSEADDFLASVVQRWEQEAAKAEEYGVRTVFARFGIILGREGGALPLMALPYKLGVGGTMGPPGKQWLSWIQVEDVAGMIQFAIEQPMIEGPLNVTAPEPMQMKDFGKTIGAVLHRPHWFPVPRILLKTMLGEMSDMLISGQRAVPDKAIKYGYSFQYPELGEALKTSLLSK